MFLSSWFAFISRHIWQWMSAWRVHVLGEWSYPPNSTETQAYHQMSACRTHPDRKWYGIISAWHWKGHMPWMYWWADITSSNSINMEQMKTSWPLKHLRCFLLRIHRSRRYDYTHSYQMWKSKIVDPIRYGWHAGDDGTRTPLYPTTLTAGVSPVPLTILQLVKCRFFTSSPLGDVGAWQLKCHFQCSAVAMLDQTVVMNRLGQ